MARKTRTSKSVQPSRRRRPPPPPVVKVECQGVYTPTAASSPSSPSFVKPLKPLHLALLEKATEGLHGLQSENVVVEREEELEEIQRFIEERLSTTFSGVLFLSGAPGTGKTCCVDVALNRVMQQRREEEGVRVLKVNAVRLQDPVAFFTTVGNFLGLEANETKGFAQVIKMKGVEEVTRIISSCRGRQKKAMSVLVVDEADQLRVTNNSGRRRMTRASAEAEDEALLSLSRLALQPDSRLVLIAIANSVHLVDRIYRLIEREQWPSRSRHSGLSSSRPFVSLLFEPYNVDQLRRIVMLRLTTAVSSLFEEQPYYRGGQEGQEDEEETVKKAVDVVMDRTALELCIRRVVAFHGDCRQTLDACRRALSSKLVDAHIAFSGISTEEDVKTSRKRPPGTPIVGVRVRVESGTGSTTDSNTDNHSSNSPEKRRRGPVDAKEEVVEEGAHKGDQLNVTPPSRREHFKKPGGGGGGDSSQALVEALSGLSLHVDSVGIRDIQTVLDTQLKSDKARNRELVGKLPLHQQLLICAACQVSAEEDYGNTQRSAADLLKAYSASCSHLNVPPQSANGGFWDNLQSLQASGLMDVEIPRTSSAKGRRRGERSAIEKLQTTTCRLLLPTAEIEGVLRHLNGVFASLLADE